MAIANSDGSIVLTTKVDQSGLKKGMSTIKSGTSALSGAFKKLGGVIAAAFSVKVLIDFSKEASNLATTTEASVQRLIDIYGSASQAVGDFIDANANALGMSKAAAASYASVYGNLFSVWADQQTNAALTTQYLNMTAVVASKTGRTVEDVQERVRSGLLGNTEAIEDLGIFVNVKTIEMTDAFKRMADGKSWEQLDAYTQQQIRSMAILEQATAKYGNEVASTTALTKAQFQAAWQDFQATWGQVVNRVLMPVLEVLTDILVTTTSVMQKLFGISSSTISESDAIEEAVESQKDLTSAVKDTNEEVEKSLAGFDDIQILTSNAAENQEESSQIGANPISIGELEVGTETSFVDAFIEKMNSLKSTLEPTTNAMKEFWDSFKPSEEEKEEINAGFEWLKTEIFEPLTDYIFSSLIPSIIDFFSEAIDSIKELWNSVKEPILDFWNNTLKPIISKIGEWILNIIDSTKESFSYAKEKIGEYSDEIKSVINGISTIIQVIWSVVKPLIQSIVNSVGNVLKTTIDFIFSIIQALGNFFSFFGNVFSALRALIEGDTEGAISYIKDALANFVNIFVGIGNAIISIINNLWTLIFNAFQGIVNSIGGLIEKIGSFLGKEWDLTWDAEVPLIPMIPKYTPKLAQGTVVPPNREFLAVLGDNKKENEVVSPISTMKQAFTEAMLEMGGNFGGSGNKEVVLEIDGREFGRAVVEQGNKENRRIGTRLVIS